MAFAETDKRILDNLLASLKDWVRVFMGDPVNNALGLRSIILDGDLPEIRRIRWYAVKDLVEAQKLWTRYVDNEEHEGEVRHSLYDFYINGATYLWLHNPVSSSHYDSFIDHLAYTLGWVQRSTAIPATTREYLGNTEELSALLKNNHWLLFMLLMAISDLEQ